MSIKNAENFKAKGARLKIVRIIAGCSTRKEFSKLSSIPLPTLESWERERSALSRKGVKRVVESLATMGVNCREEWLLYGDGEMPYVASSNKKSASGISFAANIPANVHIELNTFLQNNPRSVAMMIKDNAMSPAYDIGDIVGGIKINTSDPCSMIGSDIIIESKDGEKKVRRVIAGTKKGDVSGLCLNTSAITLPNQCTKIVEENINIDQCYKVVWVRKISISCL